MQENDFHAIADQTLSQLADALEENDTLDVDYLGGILTVTLDSGKQMVVNKHTPTRQIWLSSPFSGAGYFKYESTNWVNAKGEVLEALVQKELSV